MKASEAKLLEFLNDGGCYKSRGENVINGKNREAAGKYGKKN